MVMYLACDIFMENHLTTLDSTFFLKLMPENQGLCSQTKFRIPRIYACDTIFLDLMAVVKVRDAP